MEVSEYIKFVRSEGDLFATAAEQGELDVDVTPCPGWDMREMVRHLGLIHLWAAGNVAFPKDEWLEADDLTDLAELWPELAASWPDDAELITWYRKTLANLIRVLETAPDDVEAFTFLAAPTPLTMWSRRQASEIAVHRFDAEVSRGITSHFEPQFATDMLDELLSAFAPRPREIDMDEERTLLIHAKDVDEHWYLTIGPKGITTTRDKRDADLTVTATAAELYLSMWNRTPDSSVKLTGDTSVMDLWHSTHRVRWT